MKHIACLLLIVAAVGTAGAEWYTAYVNDFSTLDGVSVRCGEYPTACCENLRLEDGGAVADAITAGYAIMDIDFDPIDGINTDTPIDFRYGEFDITLEWYGEWWIPEETVCFWIRTYSRAWDDGAGEWVYSGRQNYGCLWVEQAETGPNWQTFTRDVDEWDERDPGFDPEQVYKIRVDSVVWDAGLVPYTFGIDHYEFTAPECPNDLDGDDDVDLADLAYLLSEYGCEPVETTLYDAGGFEGFNDGDIDGQDGWQNVGNDSTGTIMNDPTGGGMGKVVQMDATDGTEGLVAIQRLIDNPVTSGTVIYDWDQYRDDLGDNVWLCDDLYYDGWWAIQWDISDPHITTAAYWYAPGAEIHPAVWEHVCYELDLDNGLARVQIDGGDWSDYNGFNTDDIKGIEFEINDTAIEGNGAMYLDNVTVTLYTTCPVDYDGDGDTDLADLAELLGSYGCGT